MQITIIKVKCRKAKNTEKTNKKGITAVVTAYGAARNAAWAVIDASCFARAAFPTGIQCFCGGPSGAAVSSE